MDTCQLAVRDLSYIYPGSDVPALSGITFSVGKGECVCVTGNSGCGKTTLLMLIKGVLQGGASLGTVQVPAEPQGTGTMPVGIVFQNPESQIVCSTVEEEVAFGPENLCVPAAEIAHRVESALAEVGLQGQRSRSAERFSAGQKQRLALASVLSMQPALLLLDEPTSQLDARGKRELCRLLDRLKRSGYSIVLTEHDFAPFAEVIDRYLVLERGRLLRSATTASPQPRLSAAPLAVKISRASGRDGDAAVVSRLFLNFPEIGEVLKGIDLRLGKGERVQILGENGAGKSSLLRCLAGLEAPSTGTIFLAGVGVPRPERLPGKVGVLLQNPARQLFCETVEEEVAFTLRRMGHSGLAIEELAAQALSFCNIAHLGGRAPLTLSYGEQHRVALAAALAPQPGLLLLDEPFAGLDMPQRQALLDILGALATSCGTTVVIASHDVLPDPGWADRSFTMKGGILAEVPR